MSFDVDGPASLEDGLFGLGSRPDTAAVVVIPVPFEASTSYRKGTRQAPANVLEASLQVDLHDLETGPVYEAGISMLEPLAEDLDERVAQGEDLDAVSDEIRAWVRDQARRILARGGIPAVLGGDHASPLGLMEALGETGDYGVLHVDAHADLRVAYDGHVFSHASILHNALERVPAITRLVQVGVRDVGAAELERARSDARIDCWSDPELAWERAHGTAWIEQVWRMIEPLPPRVYVSFDIDGLEPALCPGTGTPVPGGLSWQQACVLLRALHQSGRRIIGFDLCEVGPGQLDALVGARLLYKLFGWTVLSRG
jgi:agmatinase